MNRGRHRPRRVVVEPVRAQLVTEFLRIRRLKLATLGVVAAAIVAAATVVPRLDDLTRDPAFVALDALALPRWASTAPRDAATGSRWCVERCRVRERVWISSRSVDETVAAYREALTAQHWLGFDTRDCPRPTESGRYRCFRRDAFALDLWVRPAPCPPRRTTCPDSTVSATVRPFTKAV